VDTATLNTLNEDVIINFEFDSLVDGCVLGLKHAFKFLSLDIGSGETVKEHTALAFGLLGGIINKTNDYLIGNKLAAVHNFLSLLAKLGALRNSVSQHISSCKVAETQLISYARSLSTLSGSRRSNEHDVLLGFGLADFSSLNLSKDILKLEVSKVSHLLLLLFCLNKNKSLIN
jgi:hypothetical protein